MSDVLKVCAIAPKSAGLNESFCSAHAFLDAQVVPLLQFSKLAFFEKCFRLQ